MDAMYKESLSPMQRFWRLLTPDQKEIKNVYIYSIFNGLVNLSLPLGIQAIINLIQGGQMNTSWVILVSLVVLGVAAAGILQIYQLRITEDLQQKIFSRAAFEFAYRIPRIKMAELYRQYAPELVNRFFDTISVQKGLSKILIDFSAAGLQVLFGLILLSFYHPFFILFSFLLVIILFAIFKYTTKKGLETSLVESKHKYKTAHWLEELARTNITFKLAGRTDLPLKRINENVENYLNARENHFKVLVRQYSLMVVFKVLVATGLLAIGGILVMEQLMNVGQFVAAEIIILLIMTSVEKLILSLETIYDVLTSLEKIGQVTDLELEQSEGIDMVEECKEEGMKVVFDQVNFRYPNNGGINTLNQLSLTIPKGERIFITGPNSSGKSTLLHVIAGLYDVSEGNIAYNGLSKGNLEQESLRSVIGDCLSQEQLFEGSILDNITMGKSGVSFEDVKWAVSNLGLNDFIKSMPTGYNTLLQPQGKSLPRSIVQKLLIARGIASKPKLLVLEDTFEHIDIADRIKIINFLTLKSNQWTLVAVSTDKYLAQKSDRIAYMKEGKIEAIGNYDTMKTIVKLNTEDHA
jgi:ABC-type bacteriocin/lantibiotic exporter with double-glycine peptidase domain